MKAIKKNFGYILLFVLIVVAGMIFFSDTSIAQVDTGLAPLEQTGLSGSDPRIIAARIIQVALGFLGIIALGLLVYAGFLWMTAAGNDEQVQRAKDILRNAAIGLVIILSAFGIVTFVISRLLTASGVANNLGFQSGRGFFPGGGGGFPTNALLSHYPERNQTGVVRNTGIFVSFTQPMLAESLLDDMGTPDNPSDDRLNQKNIKILRVTDDDNNGPFVQAGAQLTEDGRHLAIDPDELLGAPDQPVVYKVILTQGILTETGRSAFGSFGDYQWQFEVGTVTDLTPPQVKSVIPQAGSTHPRNVVIQIRFNEAMNPLTVSGLSSQFSNIRVRQANGEDVQGRFDISNQYTTVEFMTSNLCGRNSCGQDVFCLPGNTELTAILQAASLSVQAPQAGFPFDGIVDAAGNSLDGNLDGVAVGSPADDYAWSFSTTSEIDLVAPVITSVSPQTFASQVPLSDPLRATFNKPLLFSTINRANVSLDNVSYYNVLASTENNQTTITIDHGAFAEDSTYTPGINSNVKDLYQNCYQPCVGP